MRRYLIPALTACLLILAAPAVQAEVPVEGSDTEDAITQVPTYEDSDFGVQEEERVTDLFFRIAEDYLYTSEIGARTIGHVPLWPRGPLKLGPVLIFPYVVGKLGWTSNVFDDESERSSWFMTVGGGLAGEYYFMGGRGSLTFGLDYRYKRFFDRHDNFSEWTGGVGVGYKFPMGFWVRGGFKYERLVDPIEIQTKGELERDNIYPFIDIGWDEAFGNKINIEMGMDYFYADHADRDFQTGDRRQWDFHVKVSYPFLKDQTRIYLRYDYLWDDRDSDKLNDLKNGHKVVGGLEGLFDLTQTGRLRGFIEMGVRSDVYSHSRVLNIGSDRIPTDDDEDESSFEVAVGLEYLLGVKTSVDFRYLRTIQFHTSSNYQHTNRLDLGVTHNITRCLVGRAAGFFEHSDPSETATITRFGAGVGLRWIFDDNIDFHTDFDWSRRNTARKDDIDGSVFTATIGATWYLR